METPVAEKADTAPQDIPLEDAAVRFFKGTSVSHSLAGAQHSGEAALYPWAPASRGKWFAGDLPGLHPHARAQTKGRMRNATDVTIK